MYKISYAATAPFSFAASTKKKRKKEKKEAPGKSVLSLRKPLLFVLLRMDLEDLSLV